jgi:DNA helicase-2/ATP-dependent DNA helicase PcrA
MVTSFTKAAAAEISTKRSRETGQTIGLPEENVGTLHSICFNALGCPKIAETEKETIKAWNELHPNFAITGRSAGGLTDEAGTDDGNGATGATHGDRLLDSIKIRRNRMVSQRLWQREQVEFHKEWTAFKKEVDMVDFTDLIELGISKLARAPGDPRVIFVDEAQDFTNLQLALIRSWAVMMEYMVLVGDDDQSLYTWAGVSPDAMINPPIADDKKRVLKQSYRVPAAILERATRMIQRVALREPKEYQPRVDRKTKTVVEGVVRDSGGTWKEPEEIVEDIERKLKEEKSCMILASCSYMLKPIIETMKQHGIPFANRYRQTSGQGRYWNPLLRVDPKLERIDSLNMLTAFFGNGIDAPYWNVAQFIMWAQFIKTGDCGLKRKVGKAGLEILKKAIESKEQGLHTVRNVMSQVMTESACERALARDTQWFVDNLKTQRRVESLDYMVRVFKNGGVDALEDPPRVTVGTIHSVKGAESQCVYLFPDISWEADAGMHMPGITEGRDAIFRMFYVGMTRASEELILCKSQSKRPGSQPRMFVEL